MVAISKPLSAYLPWAKDVGFDLAVSAGTPTGNGMPAGALVVDITNKKLYQNTGTVSSATWGSVGDIAVGEITLTTGSILLGAAGIGAALDVKTSGQIIVGNGTTGVSVAVSGDVTLASSGAVTIAAGVVTRAKATAALASKVSNFTTATVATTGNTDWYILAPETGTLAGIDFNGVDVLATHDTNYITWSCVNLGQAGAGSTDMLDTGAVNTTKITGGSALAANTKRSLGIHGTPANLAVTKGDLLRIRAAASGTLANTVTLPRYCVAFQGTT